MSNIVQSTPYLLKQRNFPTDDLPTLSLELEKSYVDVATAVNNRSIGLFTTNGALVNGKNFYLVGQKQQGLQRVYTFTTTANIPHGIDLSNIDRIITAYGSYTNALSGGNWYGLVFDNTNVIPGQVGFYINPTNIIFTVGAGSPIPVKGTIVIEWIIKPTF